jgi:hypothetical protein
VLAVVALILAVVALITVFGVLIYLAPAQFVQG